MLDATNLWAATRARAAQALARGALAPIGTESLVVREGGLDFVVRVVEQLAKKPVSSPVPTLRDPFLPPYEPELLVGDLSPTHVALLNKFNVLREHVLIVTRVFEEQSAPLGEADLAALATALGPTASPEHSGVLGFYNSGLAAGASQPHRHLQAVPLPLGPKPAPALPVGARLDAALAAGRTRAELPFRHLVVPLERRAGDLGEAPALRRAYDRTQGWLAALGPAAPGAVGALAHNLLVTSTWMMVVPRRLAEVDGVAVNALAYAGALLVRNRAELQAAQGRGFGTLLAEAGWPPD